jgi:hypothetical protein
LCDGAPDAHGSGRYDFTKCFHFLLSLLISLLLLLLFFVRY